MRGLGNDFKMAPLSTFDIVYEETGCSVLFQGEKSFVKNVILTLTGGWDMIDLHFRGSSFSGDLAPGRSSGRIGRISVVLF